MKRIGKELSINEEIRAREVRVVSDTNEQLGVMTLHEAIRLSEEKGLDLVEVAPNGKPPVCRIMNYGKYRYEQQKRDKEAKKKQKVFQLKEVKLRPNIEDHDFYVKLKNAQRFLADGNKVKVTIMFRGREMTHPELGGEVLERFAKELGDSIVREKPQNRNKVITFPFICAMIVIVLNFIQLLLYRNEEVYDEFICKLQFQLGKI